MSIDWSEAPEWAGAWGMAGGYALWVGDSKYAYVDRPFKTHDWATNPANPSLRHRSELTALIARPSAWSGEGLPPVGAECEHRTGPGMTWSKATVLAFGEKKVFYRDRDGHEWSRLYDEIEFRPILTAEQIASELREAAITDMCQLLGKDPERPRVREMAGILYDAGYHKQEAVK